MPTRLEILDKETSTLHLFLPSLGLSQIVIDDLHWFFIDVVSYAVVLLLLHTPKNHCH